jgi:hydroxymethylbilane synthase
MRLKIASRSSDLARIQAFQVARALKAVAPTLEVEFEFRASLGDQNLDVPLASWGSKGVFTQDFFEDLKSGRYDMVVHSWKDLPTEDREGTLIAGTLERADMRDLLLVPIEAWEHAQKNGTLEILSSSPRRANNLKDIHTLMPGNLKIEFHDVRGNVPTRIGKMFGENRALILAKAALDRLLSAPEAEFAMVQEDLRAKLKKCRFMVLPLSLNPPAAAQGALAIEIAKGREDLAKLIKKIDHANDFKAVEEERATLRSHGGGCHQKIGVAVVSKPFGIWRVLRGVTDKGQVLSQNELDQKPQWPKPQSKTNIFPQRAEENSWFEREMISSPHIADASAVWVARAEAWPTQLQFKGVVWASGLKSWSKLAKQNGVWVNGCADGFGEEAPRLDELAGPLKWTKLTHADSTQSSFPITATYRLKNKSPENSPNLHGKTHFFWMSGSSFDRALELYPDQINNGYHGCGPGLTFEHLQKHVELRHKPEVFLDLEAFLKSTFLST